MLGPCALQKTHTIECNEKNKKICLKNFIFDRCNRKFSFWSLNNLNKKKLLLNFFYFFLFYLISYVKDFKLMFDWFLKNDVCCLLYNWDFFFVFSFKNLISLHFFFFQICVSRSKKNKIILIIYQWNRFKWFFL